LLELVSIVSTRQFFPRPRLQLEPLVVAALLTAVQCTDEAARPPAAQEGETPITPTWTCEDKDGDSYGEGCRMGADCDDNDAEITVQCLCADQKSPGCPCDESGAQAPCGTVYSRVGDTVVCGQGVTSCDGVEWGECIINNAVSLEVPASEQSPALRNLSLGSASACTTNPCDPACKTFTDSPENLPLANSSGVVSAASGVTLASGTSTVVPGISSSGYACTDSAYPAASGGCAHHPCRTGTALSAYCDGTSPVSTPVTIFSETFSSGNNQGWTLDSNWAIGSATSSSGHTSGNADPSSDTTSSSDNQIAGTVLGGNIGGGTLFSDGFSNLNQWTETGDGDWTTQSRVSSSGYSTSSGNPVAHSDECTGGCQITSPVINLSGQASSTLTFQYYMSSTMEAGEYLRAEAYNGTSWTTIFNRSTEAEQDSTWHSVSVSLASYLVSGFRLRFATIQTAADEAVEVDDVAISGTPTTVTSYLTSPTFNTSSTSGTVTLSFRRWLNLNTDFTGKLEIYNGSTWVQLYSSGGAAVGDSSWQTVSYDITAHKAAANRIRFSYSGASTNRVSGWNIDDISVAGTALTGGSSLCIKKVCDARPACCSSSWTIECVDMLDDVCQLECAVNSASSNACIACFNDSTLTTDIDGDGQSPATGDCRECDPGVSRGAYDLPGNNIDEDCDGTVDNEVTNCDTALSAGGDAWVHAKSLGLCKVAATNTWGVVSASFVRADGNTACSDSKQYQVMTTFGSGNLPTAGSSMSVFSSGNARVPGDFSYVCSACSSLATSALRTACSAACFYQPNGSGYDANTSSTPKYSVPAASGCNAGTAGLDSCGLKLVIRAPTNANSFRYNFNFFTSEYPEWLCTAYNDSYVAYYEGSLNTASNKNISFDSASNPVSVNNGLFTIPGWPPPALGTNLLLNGTGFDGVCTNTSVGSKYTANSICGGSTGWLQTSAPVKPGEQITMIFNVWDTGDHKWDSTVLLDNFRWSTSTATVATGTYVPPTPAIVQPATFSEGWFVRDYDMSEESDGYCGADKVPVWSLWSWNASTPGNSKVEFYVQVATTAAGLATAPRDPLLFTNPPGPTSLAGTAVIARSGSPDTRTGSATVQDALVAAGRNQNAPHLRVSAKLVPTTDLLQAPVLTSWNLQTSCQTAQ
jgi:hypothetical protein